MDRRLACSAALPPRCEARLCLAGMAPLNKGGYAAGSGFAHGLVVERFDDVGEAFVDNAAFYFQGGGEFAAVDGEFAR